MRRNLKKVSLKRLRLRYNGIPQQKSRTTFVDDVLTDNLNGVDVVYLTITKTLQQISINVFAMLWRTISGKLLGKVLMQRYGRDLFGWSGIK